MKYKSIMPTHKAKQSALAWVLSVCFLLTQIFSAPPVWGATVDPSTNAFNTARLAGGDRYETAIAVAQKGWEESEYAVVARGDEFPDALSAGPLAYAYDAPILLTAPNALNEATLQELKRLGSKKVFLVGGEAAISQTVADKIVNSGMEIERIMGGSRYDTAVAVAKKLGAKSEVILATGSDFPDTLSISALAAKLGIPILLSGKDELPKSVQAYLEENAVTKTYILGGTGVISSAIEKSVPHPVRIEGKDRYGTNIAVMEHFAAELDYSNVYVAQGNNFPDALAGAVLAAKKSAPLVLAGKTLSDSTTAHLTSSLELDTKVIGLGGKQVVAVDILAGIVNSKAQIKVSEKYSLAGTYGPESGTATIAGDVIISSRDITLRDTIIEGDLLLAGSIGDGNVELNNVTVQGKTIVNGGGPNSIILINFNGQSITVDVPEGSNVRLVAQGSTSVASLSMESNGQLQESNLTGAGFTNVVIPAGAQVTLSGTFDQVNIQSAGAQVNVQQGSINTMTIAQSATNAVVNLASEVMVTTLNAEAAASVTGQGQITNANIKTDGVSIEQKPQNVTVSEGVKDASVGGAKVDATTPPPAPPAPAAGGGGGFGGGGGGDNTPSTTPVSGISVTGDATVGQTLTANPTPASATVTYQWMRCDTVNGTYTNIIGATSKTYTLTNEDLSKFIKVTATGTGSYTGTQTSAAAQVAKIVTTADELKSAVADPSVNLIKLGADLTLDSTLVVDRAVTIDGRGFSVNQAVNIAADNVTIKNLTGTVVDRETHQLSGVGSAMAFFVNANNVTLDNIKVDGNSITPSIAVIGWKGAQYTVANSDFANVLTGVFAHLGNTESAFQNKLTATGNTFTNVWAGIGGTQKTDLTATGNTFASIQAGGEGIGLGSGVMVIGSTTPGESAADVSYLESNNTFSYGEGNKVKDYRLAAVTSKEELETALANVNTTIINISGTIGAADNYTAYEITKSVKITGLPEAKVYGSFIIKTDGVVINGLTMYTRGGGNGPLKAAIDVIAKNVTITNNIFELPNPAALASSGGVGNGVTIWPNGLASTTEANYNISGNTFVGYSADTANWSSTGLQIAEGLDLKRFNMGGTVSAVVDLGAAEEILATGNTYTGCTNNYVHSNWTGGVVEYKYYFASNKEQLSSLEYMGDGGTMLLAAGVYELSEQLKITKPLAIVGAGGVIITVADPFNGGTQNSDKHLISINSVRGLVKLENMVIQSSTRSGINVFESDNVALKNISSINNAGAGLVVNNSIVVADGLNTSGNAWGYGINVDNGSNPSLGAPATRFTLNSGIIAEAKQIVSDAGNVEIVAPPNYSVFTKDASKVFGANITSWYGDENKYLDTSIYFDFDIVNVSDIDSIKFSLYNNNELLGTRFSNGDNLVNLLKDCAQYWEKSADTYTEVKGKRTMSAAFSTRTEESNNSYWISSACTATNASVPNQLVVEVVFDNVTYMATYSR
ncbi:cell wall-binding protein [Desulfitobacterium dichloroeliminans LMG P-21439]|uniref:Cell wall-binding protein n=1 Tax=Desulfitobacterium dichloroeliminans (strain LMG P-21439 / DCA1) TaxID=871963 RepID=L0FC96_DESDL|nr:cell wall-binding repeat-containing protein [Desulfitobacterium dichloroeliminans]AGA70553.1 cell wall-binding protein [Desulfitobacterium dichloroeliminans LMG P-21439]